MSVTWHNSEPLAAGTNMVDMNVLSQIQAEVEVRWDLSGLSAWTDIAGASQSAAPALPGTIDKTTIPRFLRNASACCQAMAVSGVYKSSSYGAYSGPTAAISTSNFDTRPETWQGGVTQVRALVDALSYLEAIVAPSACKMVTTNQDADIDEHGSSNPASWTAAWSDPTNTATVATVSSPYQIEFDYGAGLEGMMGINRPAAAFTNMRWAKRKRAYVTQWDLAFLADASAVDELDLLLLNPWDGVTSGYVHFGPWVMVYNADSYGLANVSDLPANWGSMAFAVDVVDGALWASPDWWTTGANVYTRSASGMTGHTGYSIGAIDLTGEIDADYGTHYTRVGVTWAMGADNLITNWARTVSSITRSYSASMYTSVDGDGDGLIVHDGGISQDPNILRQRIRARYQVPDSGWEAA
jgi:hypothetical protein